MNKHTEEDTFKALCRPTFKEMKLKITEFKPHTWPSLIRLLNNNYWTVKEYQDAIDDK